MRKETYSVKCPQRFVFGDPLYFEEFLYGSRKDHTYHVDGMIYKGQEISGKEIGVDTACCRTVR